MKDAPQHRYTTFVEHLAAYNELYLRNKVSQGRFTGAFLMPCLTVLGADWIKVSTLDEGGWKGDV